MDVGAAVHRAGTEVLAVGEAVASRERPRLVRLLDPLDLAGTAARAVLPSHATPALAHVTYYAVLAGFVAAEVVEPPMALLLAAGHLMLQSHNRFLREAGSAVEDGA